MSYDHKHVDAKWQKRWEEAGVFEAKDGSKKDKYYVLVEFPYPSGAGLHVGHPRSYTALDIIARKKRMEGKNVLFPMGWDAFGLPAEAYAIKTGVHPSVVTKQNIDTFRRQLKAIGFSFDWSREVDTTDPKYYRWTQWMFNQFFKAGLAYKAKASINWCPKDKIGLANEEVVGGACERCGTPVEKRDKEQWMIAITKYADRLLEDLNTVDYLPKIKKQQEDWIGKSEGAEIDFELNFTHTPEANKNRDPNGEKAMLTVFTTRPDTIFGVTYIVLAPEHLWVKLATDDGHDVLENKAEVKAYLESVKSRTEIDRTNDDKEKTGVELKGVKAINPATGEEIPMYVADYVLPNYGTGVVMAVPAHDERDFAFVKKYELPVREVVAPYFVMTGSNTPREGVENAKRRSVSAIIESVEGGEFLLQIEGEETHFAGGGVEDGEDLVAALKREIQEETGYTDFEIGELAAEHIFSSGYRIPKKRNQHTLGAFFHVRLLSDRRVPSEVEQGQHQITWTPRDKVRTQITWPQHVAGWDAFVEKKAFVDDGKLVNSGEFDGLMSDEARTKIVKWLEKQGTGRAKTTYRLRDWVFSRQRYWGEPIPLVFCERCAAAESSPSSEEGDSGRRGWVAVPDEQLPVELPPVEKYEPTDNGESPLSAIDSFVNTTCPTCGGPAKRETDTMPNWAGSSWYFLRYIDPNNDKEFASKKALKYWTPVDLYNGGMEHTTLHLLYSRFWNKFLFDQGFVPTSEPYARRHSHGLIMSEDGTKMSKSKGNVVNPDEVVAEYGADAFRTYILFMGPFEEHVPWSTNGLVGVRRFLDKVERLAEKLGDEPLEVTKALNKTIQKVSDNIDGFRFNTAVSELMKFVNIVQEAGSMSEDSFKTFLTLLSPFAPHLSNELWEKLGMNGLVEEQAWPVADAKMLIDDEMKIVVQVNGKLRGNLVVPADITDAELIELAKADENVQKHLTGEIKKEIVVKGKLVNFVV
jgi:leucyl-tRNA synthetase